MYRKLHSILYYKCLCLQIEQVTDRTVQFVAKEIHVSMNHIPGWPRSDKIATPLQSFHLSFRARKCATAEL